MYQHSFTAEFGIMSVAVLTELLQALVTNNVLSPEDVRNVLRRASDEVSGAGTEATHKAVWLIESKLMPRFAEH